MKKLLTLITILFSLTLYGQTLSPITDLSTYGKNGRTTSGLQVGNGSGIDTFLAKSIAIFNDTIKLTKGITVGQVLYVVDASGKIGFVSANSIGAWTKSGTTIYPTTITDNVGIGKVPAYPFDLIAKDGGDSITLLIEGTRFEMIRYSGATDIASMSIGSTGLIAFNSTNDINLTANEFIINTTTQSTFESGDVSIEAGELIVSDDVTCDTLFGVVSGGVTTTYAYSGTYTPTHSLTTNVAASTPRKCTFSVTDSMVVIVGQFDIDPTAPGATVLGISLPPGATSNFTTVYEAGGDAVATGIAGTSGGIQANATTDVLEFRYIAVDLSNQTMSFTAGYEIK